jgi:chromate transporter
LRGYNGFVKGAYAAVIGTILGACILLGKIAIGDWLTAAIGIASLAVLFRWKMSNSVLIAATAVVGLIAYPSKSLCVSRVCLLLLRGAHMALS